MIKICRSLKSSDKTKRCKNKVTDADPEGSYCRIHQRCFFVDEEAIEKKHRTVIKFTDYDTFLASLIVEDEGKVEDDVEVKSKDKREDKVKGEHESEIKDEETRGHEDEVKDRHEVEIKDEETRGHEDEVKDRHEVEIKDGETRGHEVEIKDGVKHTNETQNVLV
jgi:hypothetical protein